MTYFLRPLIHKALFLEGAHHVLKVLFHLLKRLARLRFVYFNYLDNEISVRAFERFGNASNRLAKELILHVGWEVAKRSGHDLATILGVGSLRILLAHALEIASLNEELSHVLPLFFCIDEYLLHGDHRAQSIVVVTQQLFRNTNFIRNAKLEICRLKTKPLEVFQAGLHSLVFIVSEFISLDCHDFLLDQHIEEIPQFFEALSFGEKAGVDFQVGILEFSECDHTITDLCHWNLILTFAAREEQQGGKANQPYFPRSHGMCSFQDGVRLAACGSES